MHSSVKKDIKNVLSTAYSAIKKRNYHLLEGLSNKLNHSLTIYQNKTISICAVTVYALSKILDKHAYLNHTDFDTFRNDTLTNLRFAITAIKKDRVPEYLQSLSALQKQIDNFGGKVKIYHEPVLNYARARKAKHAIEHGLSINQATKLFNIPEWEISKLLGKSETHEKHTSLPSTNKSRVELVKRLFNIK